MNIVCNRNSFIKILIIVIVTIIATCVIILLVGWLKFRSIVDGTIQNLSSIVEDQCKVEIVTYRHPLRMPRVNGVYEHSVATSLWDIGGSVGSSNCKDIDALPPPFTHREFVYGKDNTMYGQIFWCPSSSKKINKTDTIMACIAFTGTYYSSQWNDNLKLQLTSAKELNGSVEDTQIHKGFYEVYLSLRPWLWNWFKSHHNNNSEITQLFITGRSLGGALSTICAYDFAECIDSDIVHYTFASPRVGNNTFADKFDERMPNSIRVYNTEDVVPNLPPAVWRGNVYKHVCAKNPLRGQKIFTVNTESIVDNHIEAYRELPE